MIGSWNVILFNIIMTVIGQLICLCMINKKKYLIIPIYLLCFSISVFIGYPRTYNALFNEIIFLPSISLLFYFLFMLGFTVFIIKKGKKDNYRDKILIPFLLISFVTIIPYCYITGLYDGYIDVEPDFIIFVMVLGLIGHYIIGSIKTVFITKIKASPAGKLIAGIILFFIVFTYFVVKYISQFIPSNMVTIFTTTLLIVDCYVVITIVLKDMNAVFG